MLGKKKGKLINGYVPDYVLFDLETTGISCYYDEVIEISAVKVRSGEVVAEFSELVNPGRPIPYAASRVNNITDAMVAGAPGFEEVLPAFLEFVGEDVLAGHNIQAFDMKFIYRDCEKYFGKTISNDYIDTLKLSKACFPKMRHHKLGDMAQLYGFSTAGAHRALADCRMNQKVLEKLGKEPGCGAGSGRIAESKRTSGSRSIDESKNSAYKNSENTMGSGGMPTAITRRPAKADPNQKVCPDCGSPMKKRSGMYGEFWGCTSFPDCRHTENIRSTGRR